MRITLADGQITAEVLGAGESLFLFHSLLADRTSFDRIARPLAERFRVIVPDLPGFGGSEAVTGGFGVVADRMAKAVRDACGTERPTVLGNGFGGFVALQMAIRHPALVRRLILADCGACFSEQGRQVFRTMAAVSREKGLAALGETAMRRLFAPEFQAANPELMQNRLNAFLKTDPAVFRGACDALAGLDLRPDLGKVDVPVLVLVGEQDEATPPPMSRELAAGLPNARLTILPGCAHVPPLQEPEMFLAQLASFLGRDVPDYAARLAPADT